MSLALIVAAFMMGFLGSPHCLGMCGGLVTAFGLSMQGVSAGKKRALIAVYHFGRLLSYAMLGIVAGLIGTAVLEPLMMGNSLPRILLGLVLVLIGVAMLGVPLLNKLEKVGMKFWQWLAPLRQKIFPLTTFPRALTAGLLWGYLPCGLVYGALLMAVVGHDVATGAVLMFAFGLGTVPMLVATQETVGWLHKQIGKFRLRQLNGAIMVLSGLAVIVVPMAMHAMHGHGHHGGHGGHVGHVGHSEHVSHSHAEHHVMSDASDMSDVHSSDAVDATGDTTSHAHSHHEHTPTDMTTTMPTNGEHDHSHHNH